MLGPPFTPPGAPTIPLFSYVHWGILKLIDGAWVEPVASPSSSTLELSAMQGTMRQTEDVDQAYGKIGQL